MSPAQIDERTRTGRRRTRDLRRRELLQAAVDVFSEKGIASTSVDDIVRAAGVAKGTFYLYFATKDDAINAVAAWMVESVAERIQGVAADADRSPVERLLAFGASVREVGDEPYERELVEVIHRPENRVLHDRIGERALSRLAPVVAAIIVSGIERGSFRRQDPERAGAWVMACFGSLHDVVSDADDLATAIDELNAFVLGGLGYQFETRG
jgi:AcrR family transcriptional regulator